MKWLTVMTVLVLLIRAVYTDVRRGKIENSCIVAGMITGLLLAYGGGGIEKLWISIKMAAILLTAMFFLFLIKGLGAGDIKLLCMIAVYFPEQIISIVVLSFFTAAVWAVGRMAIRWLNKNPFYIRKETVHFSIPIAVSVLIIIGMEGFL